MNLKIVSLLRDSGRDKNKNVKPSIRTLMGGFFMSIKNVGNNSDINSQDENKERALELIEQWLRDLEKESKDEE